MIKKMRNRFVLYMMLNLLLVLAIMTASFQFYYSYQLGKEDNLLLVQTSKVGSISSETIEEFYALEDEKILQNLPETNNLGIFAFTYDNKGKLRNFEHNTELTQGQESKILSLASQIMEKKKKAGKIDHFKYRIAKKGTLKYLVILDVSGTGISFQYSEYIFGIGVFLLIVLVLFLISLLLSRFVTKPAEEGLQRQKQFVADASHELKTPLSAILVNAEAMRTGEENPYLDNIQSEAIRMKKLVNSLLDLARADDRTNTLQREYFNLSDAVLQMTLPFESTAFESNINYETEIDENISYHGSISDIQQVIAILLDNAFKHTNECGTVRVTLCRHGANRRIEVFNTGSGISKEDLPHVFERFYSCDASRGKDKNSYGLGLAIAKAIIEKHGGNISVRSEYGKYARFTVDL